MIRSLFFAPANRPDLVLKFPRFGADCCVIDLEDGTPAGEKPTWSGKRHRLHHALRFGDEMWASVWHGGFRIVDIADIARPRTVASYNYHPPFPEPTHTVMPVPQQIRGRRIALAIDLSRRNIQHRTGGPFGAAVFSRDGRLLGVGVNRVVPSACSAAHAEVLALASSQQRTQSYRLNAGGSRITLATSAQPCAMCFGAVLWAGVDELLIGASGEDVESLARFDEGPLPAGAVVSTVLRPDADRVEGSYIDYIGVHRRARGRGVAKALLHTVIADAARRGRNRVGLEVDAHSPTGADGLYAAMGWVTDYRTQSWHRDLDIGAGRRRGTP